MNIKLITFGEKIMTERLGSHFCRQITSTWPLVIARLILTGNQFFPQILAIEQVMQLLHLMLNGDALLGPISQLLPGMKVLCVCVLPLSPSPFWPSSHEDGASV